MAGASTEHDSQKPSDDTFSAVPSGDAAIEDGNPDSVHSDDGKRASANYRRAAGASYVIAMGVCGIVLVALLSSLEDLAEQLGRTSIQLTGVFVARGLGAALGAVVSSRLYLGIPGKIVVSISLFLLAASLLSMALITRVTMLSINFGAIGFLTTVINAGCQIMTRRLHGSAAGPWLGANTVAFGISGALSPLVGFLTGSLIVEYSILATMTFCIAFFLVVMPEPQRLSWLFLEHHASVLPAEIPVGLLKPMEFYRNHKIEFHLGGMMFWFMGGRVTATAFIRQFVEETSAISANSASLLVSLLWLAISVGRLIALRDQQSLTLNRLLRHLMFTSVSGSIVVFVLLTSYSVDIIQWTTIIAYGFFNGPTLGYCYDLSTRVSPNPARSSAVAMFGLTAGVSIVPILTAGAWEVTGLATFLPVFLVLSHIIPCFLLVDVQKQHEASAGLRRRRSIREESFSLTAVTPTFGPPSCETTWSRADSALADGEEQQPTMEDGVQQEMEIPMPRKVADEGGPGGH